MSALTLTKVRRTLLGIITSVESGVTSPEDAEAELSQLRNEAEKANLNFRADYTVDDFRKIRENYVATYETSQDPYPEEDTYEPSYESSY
jgi:hypothetical protein